MKLLTVTRIALLISALTGVMASVVSAQAEIWSEDFTGPAKDDTTPGGSGLFEFGFDGDVNGDATYALGTWMHVSNGGIDDPAAGDEIDSTGVARPQSNAGNNARSVSVIIDGSLFTAGVDYTISFDVIGGLNRLDEAAAENSGRFWVAEVGGIDATSGIVMDVSYNGWGMTPFPRPFYTQGTGTAFVNYLTPDDSPAGSTFNGTFVIGEELNGTTTVNSFNFTYTAGTDIAFAVGTYNNDFAIDNVVITEAVAVTKWAGLYDIDEAGIVDTGNWMGLLYVENDPWIWSYSLEDWIYLPEAHVGSDGGWGYVIK